MVWTLPLLGYMLSLWGVQSIKVRGNHSQSKRRRQEARDWSVSISKKFTRIAKEHTLGHFCLALDSDSTHWPAGQSVRKEQERKQAHFPLPIPCAEVAKNGV